MSYHNLDETSKTIKQPIGLKKIKLRPHQLTSVAAMLDLETQSSIIIDKPDMTSGLYNVIRMKISDANEFMGSTYVIETNTAILADKVGSGKTYMIIGLILGKKIPVIHDRFLLGTDHYAIKMISAKETVGTNLIVVPHNLANQWTDFVSKSNLKYLTLNTISDFNIFFDVDFVDNYDVDIDGLLTIYSKINVRKGRATTRVAKAGSKTAKIAKSAPKFERKKLNMTKVNKVLSKYSVIILNVNRYKFFKQIFKSIKWARVIIDEMDSANIPAMFDEYGNFNWFLTATPTSIFYKSCRRYVNKIFGYNQHLLPYFTVKNKDEYVDQSIVLPQPYVYIINTLMQKIVSAIQDLIPPDVLRLINAGNMKEAVAKLNCDIDTEENIIKVLTDKINIELHNLKKELIYIQSVIPIDETKVKKLKDEITRCKTRLQTVNDRVNSIKDECCFICTESFNNPTILECCKNVVCLTCLLASFKTSHNKCPFCRHQIKSNSEYHVIGSKDKKKSSKPKKESKGKKFAEMDKTDVLEALLSYLAKNVDCPKILIFSDYSQTFDKIIKNIAKVKLNYAMISGTPAHMANVIEDFETGQLNILLLDSQHYGSGLNLQKANYLILFHRMTPELETQVIGRAHRFGRKIPLKIIYLINQSENSTSKMSKKPFKPEATDELWLLTDPTNTDHHTDETDSESKSSTDSKSSTESEEDSKKKKNTKVDDESEEDIKKKKTDTNEIFDDESESSTDVKKKKKKKTNVDQIFDDESSDNNSTDTNSTDDIFNDNSESNSDNNSDSESEPIPIVKKTKKPSKKKIAKKKITKKKIVKKKVDKKKSGKKKRASKNNISSDDDVIDI